MLCINTHRKNIIQLIMDVYFNLFFFILDLYTIRLLKVIKDSNHQVDQHHSSNLDVPLPLCLGSYQDLDQEEISVNQIIHRITQHHLFQEHLRFLTDFIVYLRKKKKYMVNFVWLKWVRDYKNRGCCNNRYFDEKNNLFFILTLSFLFMFLYKYLHPNSIRNLPTHI